jgi:hypothetical protein
MSEKTENYPLALPVPENQYRTLLFFAGYGKAVAYGVGVLVCAFGLTLWWLGHGAAWAPAGIILGAFAILLLNCFAELVQLIVDTMIPK